MTDAGGTSVGLVQPEKVTACECAGLVKFSQTHKPLLAGIELGSPACRPRGGLRRELWAVTIADASAPARAMVRALEDQVTKLGTPNT